MLITRKIFKLLLCYYNPNKNSYRIYKQFIVQYVLVVRLNRFLYFWELKWQILLPGGS